MWCATMVSSPNRNPQWTISLRWPRRSGRLAGSSGRQNRFPPFRRWAGEPICESCQTSSATEDGFRRIFASAEASYRPPATLITGADKGVGFETARQLIAAGHTVYIGSRDAERGRRAAGQLGARAVQLDVTDDASVEVAVKAIETHGGLGVLVNNAGIAAEWSDNDVVIGAADVTADLIRLRRRSRTSGSTRWSPASPRPT